MGALPPGATMVLLDRAVARSRRARRRRCKEAEEKEQCPRSPQEQRQEPQEGTRGGPHTGDGTRGISVSCWCRPLVCVMCMIFDS